MLWVRVATVAAAWSSYSAEQGEFTCPPRCCASPAARMGLACQGEGEEEPRRAQQVLGEVWVLEKLCPCKHTQPELLLYLLKCGVYWPVPSQRAAPALLGFYRMWVDGLSSRQSEGQGSGVVWPLHTPQLWQLV